MKGKRRERLDERRVCERGWVEWREAGGRGKWGKQKARRAVLGEWRVGGMGDTVREEGKEGMGSVNCYLTLGTASIF